MVSKGLQGHVQRLLRLAKTFLVDPPKGSGSAKAVAMVAAKGKGRQCDGVSHPECSVLRVLTS